MTAGFVLLVLFGLFCWAVATAPEEIVQISLGFVWLLMLGGTVVSIVSACVRHN